VKLTEVAPLGLQLAVVMKITEPIGLSSLSLYNILAKSEKSYPQKITFLKIPGISFKKPSPGEAGARRKGSKTRNDQTGGMFWLKFEPILEKIRKTSDSLARLRRASESPAPQDSQRPQKIFKEGGLAGKFF